MLKTPSPLQSHGSPPGGALQPPAGCGAGSSPRFRWNLLRRSFIASRLFHSIPESWTAIRTSGRPVSTRHEISTLIPVTPKSSLALLFTLASVLQKFVLAYFHFSPLHAPGMPLISFGSAMQPGGLAPDTSQRLGLAANGNSARAAGATPRAHATISSARSDRCMKGLLAMGIATRRGPVAALLSKPQNRGATSRRQSPELGSAPRKGREGAAERAREAAARRGERAADQAWAVRRAAEDQLQCGARRRLAVTVTPL